MIMDLKRRLTDIEKKEFAKVIGFSDEFMANRLMAMGILLGSKTELLFKAPLEGGFYFKIDNHRIALRNSEAQSILID